MELGSAMPRPRLLAILTALLVILIFVAGPAAALDEADRAAIQAVITRQMEAFKKRDATAAFDFASPGIQQMFGDPETFMNMVRNGYRPVYSPRSATFGDLVDGEGGPTQTVTITDPADDIWTAIYTVQKQPDGSWRISSCRLVKAPNV